MANGHHRHGAGRSHSRRGMLRRGVIALVLLVLVLAGVILLGGTLEPEERESQGTLEERFAPTLTLEYEGKTYTHEERDYTTILFIGVDQPELGVGPLRTGGQADFLLLMTIDRRDREVSLLQIDRDTVTPVQVYGVFGHPAGTRRTQICLAYAFGTDPEMGCRNTVRAVETMLGGIPIDHYVALDMEGMSLLNDALGGVTVTLTEDFTQYDPAMTNGTTLRLEGRQAEYYLRGRMEIGDGKNASRMERQAVFMEAAADLMSERMADDSGFVSALLRELEGSLTFSCEEAWLVNQAYMARNYTRTGLVRLTGEHTVGSDGFVEFHPDTNVLLSYIISTFCE